MLPSWIRSRNCSPRLVYFLALGAAQFLITDARLLLQPIEIAAVLPLFLTVVALQVLVARELDLLLEIRNLAVERAHLLDGAINFVDQPLALQVGEPEIADQTRDCHLLAAEIPAQPPVLARLLLLRYLLQLLGELNRLLIVLAQFLDAPGDVLEPVLQDLLRELFFVEDDHFLDGAHTTFQIFADRQNLADDNGRAGKRLEHTELPAFDTLGDLHLAFARKQRDRAHLPQVHAYRIVGLLESARREVELHIFAGLDLLLELLT